MASVVACFPNDLNRSATRGLSSLSFRGSISLIRATDSGSAENTLARSLVLRMFPSNNTTIVVRVVGEAK
jgi:hypothetical protein